MPLVVTALSIFVLIAIAWALPVSGADLRIPRERHAISKPILTPAPKYESYFQGLPNKLNPKEPPVERPAGLP